MKPCESNINQSTQNRGRNTRNKNGRTTRPRRPKNHLRGRKTRGNIKVPEPSWVMMRSISNKERGGPI